MPQRSTETEARIRAATIALALAWDTVFGEPDAAVHPTVWMGRMAAGLMAEPSGNPERDSICGAEVAAAVPEAAAKFGSEALELLQSHGLLAEIVGGAFLLKTTFAVRSMREHALAVAVALESGDIESARHAVAKIVSRDVSKLDADGIANTCIGTVAENVTDAAVAPLLAYAVFGLPGAMAYRAINTLDAMYGYHGKFEDLGRACARLDDLANLLPARLAGPAVTAASAICGFDAEQSWEIMQSQNSRTESPNSGWTIGATAGALGAEIEKVGYYRLGPADRKPKRSDIVRSIRLFSTAALLAGAIATWIAGRAPQPETRLETRHSSHHPRPTRRD